MAAGRSATSWVSRRAGMRPARSSEDLPLPDAPNTAANRRRPASSSTSEVSLSRPKNRLLSPGSNRAKPRYGGSPLSASSELDAAASSTARFQRASHSAGSPPHASTYARTTASVGNRSPAAACDSAVTP